METWQLALVVSIIPAVVGLGTSILTNRWAKSRTNADVRKVDAEATQTLTAAALAIIDQLQEDVEDLRKRAESAELRAKVAEAKAEVAEAKAETAKARVEALESKVQNGKLGTS